MRGWLVVLTMAALCTACAEDDAATSGAGAGSSSGGSASVGGAGGDGGAGGVTSSAGGGGSGGEGGAAPMGDPLIVTAGYGGRRMRSLDLGLSWIDMIEDDPNGGDDQNLLRAVSYAEDVFVAVGWRIHATSDGVSWSEHSVNNQQWCGGVAYGNGLFLCVGGCGRSYTSLDGQSWQEAGNATEALGCSHMRSLAYGNGVFVAAGDNGLVTTTTDGASWTNPQTEDVGGVVFRNGMFLANGNNGDHKTSSDGLSWAAQTGPANTEDFGHGVYLRGVWGGGIERSDNGVDWTEVFNDGGNALQGFAFGYTTL